MRRATLFRVLGAVLVVALGGYCAFWWVAAGKIKDAATAWCSTAHDQKIDASWRTMHVTGFPLSLRLELGDAVVKDSAASPITALQAPTLIASIRPWDFRDVAFVAPEGLSVMLGPDGAPIATISAEHGTGAASVGGDGGATLWLSLYGAKATAGMTANAKAVHAWVIVPHGAQNTALQSGFALAIDAHDLTPPLTPPGFGGMIDDLGFGVTLSGAILTGPARQAAAAWHNSGGTVELDHLHLRWGDMEISGSGTLALDNDLQPVGGFSGGVSGFDQLLSALVATGRIKSSDARVARLALAMLAKAGPDGRPEITSSLTIQNGEMYLGPAKLGPAPRIDW